MKVDLILGPPMQGPSYYESSRTSSRIRFIPNFISLPVDVELTWLGVPGPHEEVISHLRSCLLKLNLTLELGPWSKAGVPNYVRHTIIRGEPWFSEKHDRSDEYVLGTFKGEVQNEDQESSSPSPSILSYYSGFLAFIFASQENLSCRIWRCIVFPFIPLLKALKHAAMGCILVRYTCWSVVQKVY